MVHKHSLISRFCRCIKHVRKTIRPRSYKNTKESAAIGVCIRSVIHNKHQSRNRRRTLKKFRCGLSPYIKTRIIDN